MLAQVMTAKALSASILSCKPELCIDRNYFYEEACPLWDISQSLDLEANGREKLQRRGDLPG